MMLFRNDKTDPPGPTAGGELRVPLLPLRDIIVFPHMVVPLFVGRQKSIRALEEAMNKQKSILLAAQKDAKTNEPAEEDIYRVGTLGTVVQLLRLPDGTVKVLVEGKQRARVARYLDHAEYFLVEAEPIEERCDKTTEVEALIRSVNSTFENYVKLNKKIPPEMIMSVASIDDPARLADTIVAHLGIKLEDKQTLLEMLNPAERLEKVLGFMRSEIEILEVEKRIRYPGQEADGEDPEGVLPQRADARDPEGARREGRVQERDPGARREDQAEEDVGGGAGEGGEGAEEAQDDVADVRRGDGRPQLHRLAHLAAVARVHRGQARHQRRREGARRGSLRPREGEAAHPRVPRGAEPRRAAEGADPLPGRTSGRRQDVARQVDRPRHRPQVRARVARRRARRGRDPRPSPHLHRRAARQDHPVDEEGRLGQPGLPARRGRQDVDRLPRRSVVGAARGARPRAEQRVQRPLPRRRLRPLEGHVHHHREHARAHPASAPGSHGDHPDRRLHRAREAQHRQALPDPEAARGERPAGGEHRLRRQRAPRASFATTRRKRASGTSSARSRRSAARSRSRS